MMVLRLRLCNMSNELPLWEEWFIKWAVAEHDEFCYLDEEDVVMEVIHHRNLIWSFREMQSEGEERDYDFEDEYFTNFIFEPWEIEKYYTYKKYEDSLI